MNGQTPRISRRLFEKVKLHPRLKQYEIAQRAKLTPDVLSRILGGYASLKPEDPRVLRLGKVVGLKPSQCFE